MCRETKAVYIETRNSMYFYTFEAVFAVNEVPLPLKREDISTIRG
jgi:hypothetical protein